MFHQVILSSEGVSFQCVPQEDTAAAENLSSPIFLFFFFFSGDRNKSSQMNPLNMKRSPEAN